MDSSSITFERRGEARLPLRGLARVVRPSGHPPETVRLLDISPTGLGYVSQYNDAPGTLHQIEFSLPGKRGGETTLVRGETSVVQPILSAADGGFRVSASFARFPAEARLALDAYIQRASSASVC